MDCKVYVGNLGNNAAKHELESAFSKYGPLVNVWVARNPPGFAFVEFEDPRDAEDAVRALDGTWVAFGLTSSAILGFIFLAVFILKNDFAFFFPFCFSLILYLQPCFS